MTFSPTLTGPPDEASGSGGGAGEFEDAICIHSSCLRRDLRAHDHERQLNGRSDELRRMRDGHTPPKPLAHDRLELTEFRHGMTLT
jgi:hypothetical protein